jgi:acyl-CoA thioesterase I
MTNIMRISLFLCSAIFLLAAGGCAVSSDRAGDLASAKPLRTPPVTANLPKIIAFGDSLTAGFGLTEKESYPYLLQQRLTADGFQYEVVNAGVSGDTTLGGLERAEWVLDQENARILILELGANDLLRGVPVAQTKSNLEKIIRMAKAKNIEVLFCGMLAPPTMGPQYQRDYNMLFSDLAEKYNLVYLPFLLDGIALNKDLNQADGIHPNVEGTKRMAENIYTALKPMLRR